MCIHLDRHHLSVPWPILDHAFGKGLSGHAAHPRNRPKAKDHRSKVVGAQIKQRPTALGIIEIGVRMVPLDPVSGDEGRHSCRFPDKALVNRLAQGLPATAQKRVRRIANSEAFGRRKVEDAPAIGQIGHEWLFGIDMFARVQSRHRDLGMGCGDCQVEDRVNFWVRDDLIGSLDLRDSESLSFGAAFLHIQAAASNDVHTIKARAIF